MAMPNVISANTLIPIGLVITLMGVCVSIGVTYNKVEETRSDVAELKIQLSRMDDKIDTLSQRSVADSIPLTMLKHAP